VLKNHLDIILIIIIIQSKTVVKLLIFNLTQSIIIVKLFKRVKIKKITKKIFMKLQKTE